MVDVTHFGATGDGVTDDTLAIQSAIAAWHSQGGVLHFPPGVYVISDTLQLSRGKCVGGSVTCDGVGQATFCQRPGAATVVNVGTAIVWRGPPGLPMLRYGGMHLMWDGPALWGGYDGDTVKAGDAIEIFKESGLGSGKLVCRQLAVANCDRAAVNLSGETNCDMLHIVHCELRNCGRGLRVVSSQNTANRLDYVAAHTVGTVLWFDELAHTHIGLLSVLANVGTLVHIGRSGAGAGPLIVDSLKVDAKASSMQLYDCTTLRAHSLIDIRHMTIS